MSVQTDLEARTARLSAILEDSNEAVTAKGGTTLAADLAGLPAAIRAIPESSGGGDSGSTEPVLEALTVTPTGKTFVRYPSGDGFSSVTVNGDSDLRAENLPLGLTIYGVEGESPMLGIPEEYREYFEYARENLYSGDYAHIVIWDTGDEYDWLAVSFLMEDFEITSYDLYTTEIKATGWHTCGYTKSTGEWTSHNYKTEESPGGNYAKHIIFASCPIVYGEQTLFPLGIGSNVRVTDVSFNEDDTFTATYATGDVITWTFNRDSTGAIVSITDSNGHVTTLSGVSG